MNPTNQPINQPAGGLPGTAPTVTPQQSSAKSNPNSTQNTLQISEIRDGIVILNDGSFRAVVMCKSINFDLMSPQEREAVEFSYQGFLNSLYFPIQIFMRSQKVDLRPYLERLDNIRGEQDNMLLGLLMEDYVAFLSDISQQTNIMDKKFYVVIKYPDIDQDIRKALKQSTGFFSGLAGLFSPGKSAHVVIDETSLEKAKTELRNRVQAVMQGLSEAGIQSIPLDTEELIELYYDAYNPDTATRQQIKDFSQLSAPVVTKGESAAPQSPAAGGMV
jgi:type IV secretory pathway VirB4 component